MGDRRGRGSEEAVAGWRVLGEQMEWVDQQRSATKKIIVH